jgi:invasion protein IalB
MQRAEKIVVGLFAGALLLAATSAADAQQTRPPAAPPAAAAPAEPAASDTPQHTTASYTNWVLACDTQNGPPPQKTCEISQVVQTQVQGRPTPIARVAIARPLKGQPIKLTVTVLPNITFATAARVQTADNDPGIAVPFARCAPTGCFADFDIKDDVVRKFRAATANGKITYGDFTGHEVVIPFSFTGFAQALDALGKE